jgi:hypothetical protein
MERQRLAEKVRCCWSGIGFHSEVFVCLGEIAGSGVEFGWCQWIRLFSFIGTDFKGGGRTLAVRPSDNAELFLPMIGTTMIGTAYKRQKGGF